MSSWKTAPDSVRGETPGSSYRIFADCTAAGTSPKNRNPASPTFRVCVWPCDGREVYEMGIPVTERIRAILDLLISHSEGRRRRSEGEPSWQDEATKPGKYSLWWVTSSKEIRLCPAGEGATTDKALLLWQREVHEPPTQVTNQGATISTIASRFAGSKNPTSYQRSLRVPGIPISCRQYRFRRKILSISSGSPCTASTKKSGFGCLPRQSRGSNCPKMRSGACVIGSDMPRAKDSLTPEQRSALMGRVRQRGTKYELILRRALWKAGYRYRLRNKLPGTPDIVFSGVKVAIFVDGCFWHGCPVHGSLPSTRQEFWEEKLIRNRQRDQEVDRRLHELGWIPLRLWEHDVRDDPQTCVATIGKVIDRVRGSARYSK